MAVNIDAGLQMAFKDAGLQMAVNIDAGLQKAFMRAREEP
jgi:hypothetical protein